MVSGREIQRKGGGSLDLGYDTLPPFFLFCIVAFFFFLPFYHPLYPKKEGVCPHKAELCRPSPTPLLHRLLFFFCVSISYLRDTDKKKKGKQKTNPFPH